MKLYFHRILTCALLTAAIATKVYAGGMSTGGGSAVVCRDSSNRITYSDLLDLFEGRERFQLGSYQSQEDYKQQIEKAFDRLNSSPALKWFLKNLSNDILAKQSFLPKHLGLHLPSDIGTDYAAYILDGCRLETIGFYEIDGTLRIATKVYESLPETSKAAFLLHETIYKAARDLVGESNSTRTRLIVAKLFSARTIDSDLVIELKKLLEGSSPMTARNNFVAYEATPNSTFKIQFASEPGHGSLAATLNVKNKVGEIVDTLKHVAGTPDTIRVISSKDVNILEIPPTTVYPEKIIVKLDESSQPIYELDPSTMPSSPMPSTFYRDKPWRVILVPVAK